MSELPRGTVTFAFTDIEDSTELLKRLGDGYQDVLSEHRRLVREAFGEAGGIEIDRQGDAFFFVFPRARDALAAAVETQRTHAAAAWPGEAAVRVRIGLHTGEPAVHEEGYVGLDVVRAARICSLGRGGQILLSEATRALLGPELPYGVSVFPLGQRHLRGLDEPERVYEAAVDDLEDEAPAAAPAAPPAEPGGVAGLGRSIAEQIQDHVLGRLEEKLARRPESGVDAIESRLDALADEIDARVRAALARKGRDGESSSSENHHSGGE